jgi:hypothetical protein
MIYCLVYWKGTSELRETSKSNQINRDIVFKKFSFSVSNNYLKAPSHMPGTQIGQTIRLKQIIPDNLPSNRTKTVVIKDA